MKVGFIGIGTMGGHMAYNLCKAEYEVAVHDLNRDLSKRHIDVGATWADSVKAIAQKHIATLTERIAAMQSMQRTLQTLVHCCHGDDRPDCPILDDLASADSDLTPVHHEPTAPRRRTAA